MTESTYQVERLCSCNIIQDICGIPGLIIMPVPNVFPEEQQ